MLVEDVSHELANSRTSRGGLGLERESERECSRVQTGDGRMEMWGDSGGELEREPQLARSVAPCGTAMPAGSHSTQAAVETGRQSSAGGRKQRQQARS